MENVKNVNLAYGVIGLVVGVVITSLFCWNSYNRDVVVKTGTMHQMPDGTMMNNTGTHMENMMDTMMAGLEGKTGNDFDKEFLAEMIVHHQGAVEMAKAVLETSKRPELIKLANDIISAQNKEIGMMQGWQKAWFK